MTKVVTIITVALFTIGVNAQDTAPKKEKAKKESCCKKTSTDKKSCCVKK
ncbi:hypothetical protein [Flavobacterium sp. LC2016-01]|nr:hypothetical protein [Flavobacterium sp. LC2016-01]MTH17207.1 hypothetical protein [Flavobacterium sp. LC2016-01]